MASQNDHAGSGVIPFRSIQVVNEAEHDQGPLALSDEELLTLRRLARRLRDGLPGAVNIRQAQQLAARGLAKHDRGGWGLTPAGASYLTSDRQPRNAP